MHSVSNPQVRDLILYFERRMRELLLQYQQGSNGAPSAQSVIETTVARTAVKVSGVLIGERRTVNIVPDGNVSVLGADDPGNEEIILTLSASGGSASSLEPVCDTTGSVLVDLYGNPIMVRSEA